MLKLSFILILASFLRPLIGILKDAPFNDYLSKSCCCQLLSSTAICCFLRVSYGVLNTFPPQFRFKASVDIGVSWYFQNSTSFFSNSRYIVVESWSDSFLLLKKEILFSTTFSASNDYQKNNVQYHKNEAEFNLWFFSKCFCIYNEFNLLSTRNLNLSIL